MEKPRVELEAFSASYGVGAFIKRASLEGRVHVVGERGDLHQSILLFYNHYQS